MRVKNLLPWLLCAAMLCGCAASSQGVKQSSTGDGDSTQAAAQTESTGFFSFAKTTQAVGLAGGSLLSVIMVILVTHHKQIMAIIPLVNKDADDDDPPEVTVSE